MSDTEVNPANVFLDFGVIAKADRLYGIGNERDFSMDGVNE
jgi:hypothetical protein